MNFKSPEEWPRWEKRFERFRVASGLSAKSGETQVNTFIYCMGQEAEDIFAAFSLNADDAKKFDVVKARFEAYFVVRRNVIFERAKFNQRKQADNEPVETFITALHTLSEHCGYADLRDEMIRDRLVVGLRNVNLSEKLQLDPDLTLEKAVAQARQSELVKKQQSVVRNEKTLQDNSANIDHVGARKKWKPPIQKRHDDRKIRNMAESQDNYKNRCHRCGARPGHSFELCPAKNSKCFECNKMGHFGKMCRNKQPNKYRAKLHEVHLENDSDSEEAFLGSISTEKNRGDEPWRIKLRVDKSEITFKIDTGADVTVIPYKRFLKMKNNSESLQSTSKVLIGPGKKLLEVRGKFRAKIRGKTGETEQEIFVVSELECPLLGRPAIKALDLVKVVGSVRNSGSKIFSGLGRLEGAYKIELENNYVPHTVTSPRRIPMPYFGKVKDELNRMEKLGVISKVEEPTEWCSGIVIVPKPNGHIRICTDYTKLNEAVKREIHQMPVVDETLSRLSGAKIFSKLDANCGFWQIPLTEDSSLLTTFITPFGRFRYHRLPFGISSAPEIFQRKMNEVLEGLEGVICQMDDTLVFGSNQEEHDARLAAVLERIEQKRLTLNEEKCKFSQTRVTFLGHVIDEQGIHPDPHRIEALMEMDKPNNITELRRFLGMVNQLGKFSPRIAELTKPLRDLLSLQNEWYWAQVQDDAFNAVKKELVEAPALALYDPSAETRLSADASSYGMGAILLQKQNDSGQWRPVAFASRSMTKTEMNYAQVEKEALATTWACDKFRDLITGMQIVIESDHKPLLALLGYKPLSELSPRLQRFRMRLMRYSYKMVYTPGSGSSIRVADTLSRAPINQCEETDEELAGEVSAYVESIIAQIPVTNTKLSIIKSEQQKDMVCAELMKYSMDGWPDKSKLAPGTNLYWAVRDELTVHEGLLLRNCRLVIPQLLKEEILSRIHEGHQGIVKCRRRASESVWWPGMSREIADMVRDCVQCAKHRKDQAEPMMSTPTPDRPWQTVGSDLFHWKGSEYVLVVDYFSRYIEINKLEDTTSQTTIVHLKSIFSRHGIPDKLVSDNGPQYNSETFRNFAHNYGFQHVTSSPKYPQGNGEAERAVQTVKRLLAEAKDPYIALLTYRSTPLQHGKSPAELLMGRKLQSTLPSHPSILVPKWKGISEFRKIDSKLKDIQKMNYDHSHRVQTKSMLKSGDNVWVKNQNTCIPGIVKQSTNERSYIIDTPRGSIRRNRRHLSKTSMPVLVKTEEPLHSEIGEDWEDFDPGIVRNESSGEMTSSQTVTRSGRVSKAPTRLDL